MVPCTRQMLGKGPMQDLTTQKHDYTWKCIDREKPLKPQLNIYCPCAGMTGNTKTVLFVSMNRALGVLTLSLGSCNIKYDKLMIVQNTSLMSSKDLDAVDREETTSLSLYLRPSHFVNNYITFHCSTL